MEIGCSEITKVVSYLCEGVSFCLSKDVLENVPKVVVFLEIGEQVDIVDGHLHSAINQGVCEKQNTGENISIKIYTGIISGDDADKVKITVFTKIKDAENMSALEILKLTRSTQRRTVIIGGHAKCLI